MQSYVCRRRDKYLSYIGYSDICSDYVNSTFTCAAVVMRPNIDKYVIEFYF